MAAALLVTRPREVAGREPPHRAISNDYAVPTFAQHGVAGLEAGIWMGLMAPQATPQDVVARLAAEVRTALRKPEVLGRLRALGAKPAYAPPDEFAARMAGELTVWSRVMQDAGIRLE